MEGNTVRFVFGAQLTELKAMLGVVGQTRIVMGCITQTEDGRFSIEDLSASLRLDLSDAVVAAGFITGTKYPSQWTIEAQIVFKSGHRGMSYRHIPFLNADLDSSLSSMA